MKNYASECQVREGVAPHLFERGLVLQVGFSRREPPGFGVEVERAVHAVVLVAQLLQGPARADRPSKSVRRSNQIPHQKPPHPVRAAAHAPPQHIHAYKTATMKKRGRKEDEKRKEETNEAKKTKERKEKIRTKLRKVMKSRKDAISLSLLLSISHPRASAGARG